MVIFLKSFLEIFKKGVDYMVGAFGFKAKNVEFPTGAKGETYHLGALDSSLPKYWIIPGSYTRADSIRELWTDVNDNPCPLGTRPYQYHAVTGKYKDVPMGICSTGIGASAGEITMVEAIYGGGRYFVRAGTSGCNDKEIMSGDVVILNESRGNVGTVMEYLGKARMFDFIPSTPEVVEALEKACLDLGLEKISGTHERGKGFKVGRGYCADSFYAGQGRVALCPLTEEMEHLFEDLDSENVLTIEMETPGHAAVILAHRERSLEPYSQVGYASILTPVANRKTGDWNESKEYQMQTLRIASEAFVLLDRK